MTNNFSDQRIQKRIHLIYYLRVFDVKTNKVIGHLVDITTEGIMIISEDPIEIKKNYTLKMDLPNDIKGNQGIEFEATSMWAKKDVNPDFIDTGFKLLNITDEDKKIINQLIDEFLFNS